MRTTVVVAALAALLLSGCGSDDGAAQTESTLSTADSDLGEVVVDSSGRTVYAFDEDEPGSGESACSADCLKKWPPVAADPELELTADGVEGELDTIRRDDGTLQVTLGGAPLYLFAGDGEAGDVTGQGVGGVWWVVGADGQKITKTPADAPDFSY